MFINFLMWTSALLYATVLLSSPLIDIDPQLVMAVSATHLRNIKTCDSIQGLSDTHRALCRKHPQLMDYVRQGVRQAEQECHNQFKRERWNCTSIDDKPFNKLIKRGFKESAFSFAIVTAGIGYKVTAACMAGSFPECFCQEKRNSSLDNSSSFHFTNGSSWHIKGCHDSVDIATEMILKPEPKRRKRHGVDTKSLVMQQNNRVGTQALMDNVILDCKCHGMTGTCATRTCFRKPPQFQVIGDYLRQKFHLARRVATKSSGYGLLIYHNKGERPPEKRELVYYEKSPTFCKADSNLNWGGTKGRECTITGDPRQADSCSVLCCNRGYEQVVKEKTVDCSCTKPNFFTVQCQTCNVGIITNVCK